MDSSPNDDELALPQYLRVFWRNRLYVIVPIILCAVAGAYVASKQTPTFASRAEVLVQSETPEDAVPSGDASGRSRVLDDSQLQTELSLMQSQSIRRPVLDELGRPINVTIAPVSNGSQVVAISATSNRRQNAQEDAQTYADTYVSIRRAQLADALDRGVKQVETDIAEIDAGMQPFTDRLAEFDAQIAATLNTVTRAGLQDERDSVLAQRNDAIERRSRLEEQMDKLQLAQQLSPTAGVRVVSEAPRAVPTDAGQGRRLLLAAVVFGTILGLMAALAREHLKPSVRTKKELEAATGGRPVLGQIPPYRRRGMLELAPGAPLLSRLGLARAARANRSEDLVTRSSRRSPADEAYRAMRASLLLRNDRGREPKTILVTSPSPGDGKTTVVANLAVVLAAAGRRVVLIDCDFHRPELHRVFGLDNQVGLTSVLLDKTSLADALRRAAPGLAVITAGPPEEEQTDLLSTDRFAAALGKLSESADIVLVDSPPLLAVSDGLEIAGLSDLVVLVARANRTSKADIGAAIELLEQLDQPAIGTVLNASRSKPAYAYQKKHSLPRLAPGARRLRPDDPDQDRQLESGAPTETAEKAVPKGTGEPTGEGPATSKGRRKNKAPEGEPSPAPTPVP